MADVPNDTQDAQQAPDTQPTSDVHATQDAQATQNAQAAPGTPDLADKTADKTRPLDDLIASIRTAVAPGASAEARAVGSTACRSILAALEAKTGQPLTAAPPTAPPPPSPSPPSPLVAMLAQLATMPREQMLEFIANFLRSKLPPGTQTQVTAGPRFHLIQLPQMRQSGGGS